MKYNITSVEDIQRIQEAILNNETVEIGEIKPIHFKLKLDGGRFENYNPKFIDKFVAQAILSQQTNYERFLKEIEKQYNVKISKETKLLKFELENGSLELLTDLLALTEVFKNMESIHQLYAVLGITGGWLSYLGFGKYIEKTKHELEVKSKEKLEELSGAEKARYLETINKTVEALKEVALNPELQKAINKPKQDLSAMLEDDEVLTFNDDTSHKITNSSAPSFEYIAPQVEDIEEEIEGTYTIESYNFHKEGKLFKLVGVPQMANSEIISAQNRMKLLAKAENKEDVKLKVKITKDGVTRRIKSIYIIDVDFS